MFETINKEDYIEVGYWNNEYNDYPQYPHPKDLIDASFWKGLDKKRIKEYLDTQPFCMHAFGFARCRICDKVLGTSDRTDGTFVWPDKLSHYIYHDVKLPKEFIKHILGEDHD